MADSTLLVIEHARANGGIVTTSEAQALGMDRATLARRVDTGVLTRVKRGVFALPGLDIGHDADLEAACRRLNAVVSHQSAGRLHQFEALAWVTPTVSVPHRHTKLFPGVYVHQMTDLSDDQVISIGGLPVTNPERTVIDLASCLSDSRLDVIVDRALSTGTLELEKLADLFATLGRRGKPGTARMRRLLEKRDQEYAPPESQLELKLLGLIREAELPEPELQFQPSWLAPTNGRVDFAYPSHRLIIEADSRKWHTLMKSFDTDRHRDNQAQLAGWRILRFTWRDIREDPLMVTTVIGRALEV
ncbi:MAG: type IV toxin-antitoxin system AbiEi family antitoxin domain-containing protein [Acidimicrobiia bacterium]